MKLKKVFDYLDLLESMIDLKHIEATRALQQKTFSFQKVDHIPTVISYPVPDDEWPAFNFEEIFHNQEKMLLNELHQVFHYFIIAFLRNRFWENKDVKHPESSVNCTIPSMT